MVTNWFRPLPKKYITIYHNDDPLCCYLSSDYGLDMITLLAVNVTIESKFSIILVQYERITNMKHRILELMASLNREYTPRRMTTFGFYNYALNAQFQL